MNIFSFVAFLLVLESINSDKLVLVQVLYRHGQRSPSRFYPKDPHKKEWAMGLGQLTNIGRQNEYELGQFLKKRYIDIEFMNKSFNTKDIYVRSTDVDRTLESAELVLAGLYPPSADNNWNKTLLWQPIPVHTVPRKEDNLLLYGGPYCPMFWEEDTRAHKVNPLKALIDKYKDMFNYLSSKTGMKITIANAWIVFDDTFNELLHKMPVPAWIKSIWPRFLKESNETFGLFVPTSTMKKLKGGPLVKEMLSRCDRHINYHKSIKMYQYSAHDVTIGIWLTVLGIYNGIHPPYSTAAMVELYQMNNTNSKYPYAIKILYRNDTKKEPYTFVIPGCTEFCPIEKFKELTKDIIPGNLTLECMVHHGSAGRTSATLILSSMCTFLLFLVN